MSSYSEIRPRQAAAATFASQLTLVEVYRSFGGPSALEGISIDIQPGEVMSLLGPSGCGKTTLLRIAAGVDVPNSGAVLIDGRVVASDTEFVPPEKRGIGMMFQDYALFPHMSILENVMFGLTALSRPAARDEAMAALARLGLERLKDGYPHELSGGEQQRAALARAIVPRPGILLMDEPFSGLDVRLRSRIRNETLAVLRESGSTAVIVTHDPQEAMMMSDRVALMRAGKIEQVGTPQELYLHPNSLYAARFFSPLNEISAQIESGNANTVLGTFPIGELREGEAVIVAIRPQNIDMKPVNTSDGLPGRVVARRFLGEMVHYDVAVNGFDDYLMVSEMSGIRYESGQDVRIIVHQRDAMVFSALAGTY